jgi:hypothetical protein
MPAINERQALIMEGATILGNDNGTAPGMLLREGGVHGRAFAGTTARDASDVPGAGRAGSRAWGDVFILRRKLSIFGLTESGTDEWAGPDLHQIYQPIDDDSFQGRADRASPDGAGRKRGRRAGIAR